jgi:hypothetical protein
VGDIKVETSLSVAPSTKREAVDELDLCQPRFIIDERKALLLGDLLHLKLSSKCYSRIACEFVFS